MSASIAILVVGISEPTNTAPEALRAKGVSAEHIRQASQAMMKAAAEKGYDLKPVLISPDNVQKGIEEFEEKLQSQKWDGVMVGFGIRGDPQFTEVFEQLMNLCRVKSPESQLVFNTEPKDVLPSILRTFKE